MFFPLPGVIAARLSRAYVHKSDELDLALSYFLLCFWSFVLLCTHTQGVGGHASAGCRVMLNLCVGHLPVVLLNSCQDPTGEGFGAEKATMESYMTEPKQPTHTDTDPQQTQYKAALHEQPKADY